MKEAITAGMLYFILGFPAGFVLGPMRSGS